MTTDKARAEAEALRTRLESSGRYGPHPTTDPHDGSVEREVERILAEALTARDAEAEGLREAVRVLAAEIRLRIIDREAIVLGEPDAWIKRSAVLKFVIDERLANPIAKAAIDAAGGA